MCLPESWRGAVVFLDYLFQVLPALSEREGAKRLAKLGGSEPQLESIPRRSTSPSK